METTPPPSSPTTPMKPAPTTPSSSTYPWPLPSWARRTDWDSAAKMWRTPWDTACITSRYQLLERLGAGSYGEVALARDHETGRRVAIKRQLVFHPQRAAHHSLRCARELAVLRSLRGHANVLQLLTVLPPPTSTYHELYIVTEALDADLSKLLKQAEPLLEHHLRWFAYKLLFAVAVLHEKGLVHRDLKPHNIFITESCALSVGDFGLARAMGENKGGGAESTAGAVRAQTSHICTRHYRPPEVLFGAAYCGRKVDMWGVACVLAELFQMAQPAPNGVAREALFPGSFSTMTPPAGGAGPAHRGRDQLALIMRVLGRPQPGKPRGAGNTWTDAAREVGERDAAAGARMRAASAGAAAGGGAACAEAPGAGASGSPGGHAEEGGEGPLAPWRRRFPGVPDDLLDLLLALLSFDPQKRPAALEALRSDCFNTVRSPSEAAELARAKREGPGTAKDAEGLAANEASIRGLLNAEISALNPGALPTWAPA